MSQPLFVVYIQVSDNNSADCSLWMFQEFLFEAGDVQICIAWSVPIADEDWTDGRMEYRPRPLWIVAILNETDVPDCIFAI